MMETMKPLSYQKVDYVMRKPVPFQEDKQMWDWLFAQKNEYVAITDEYKMRKVLVNS